ncbi:hypothetical protein BsWGS_12986 [Bradybaena similaris]
MDMLIVCLMCAHPASDGTSTIYPKHGYVDCVVVFDVCPSSQRRTSTIYPKHGYVDCVPIQPVMGLAPYTPGMDMLIVWLCLMCAHPASDEASTIYPKHGYVVCLMCAHPASDEASTIYPKHGYVDCVVVFNVCPSSQ